MNDTSNQRIRVVTVVGSSSYIDISVDLSEKVRKLLQENDIPHWMDHLRISVNDRPPFTVIHLGRKADPTRVQELLDAVG